MKHPQGLSTERAQQWAHLAIRDSRMSPEDCCALLVLGAHLANRGTPPVYALAAASSSVIVGEEIAALRERWEGESAPLETSSDETEKADLREHG